MGSGQLVSGGCEIFKGDADPTAQSRHVRARLDTCKGQELGAPLFFFFFLFLADHFNITGFMRYLEQWCERLVGFPEFP